MSRSHPASPAPASRRQTGYRAFLAHRISGVALALFLPLHFLALGTALEGEARLDSFLAFTDNPLVKAAEWGLVIFLGLHLMLGLRLIVLELGTWRGMRQNWITWSAGVAIAIGLAFIAVVIG
jgi:fumarate reductase subunit D